MRGKDSDHTEAGQGADKARAGGEGTPGGVLQPGKRGTGRGSGQAGSPRAPSSPPPRGSLQQP